LQQCVDIVLFEDQVRILTNVIIVNLPYTFKSCHF
jgi:hypothetical protein